MKASSKKVPRRSCVLLHGLVAPIIHTRVNGSSMNTY